MRRRLGFLVVMWAAMPLPALAWGAEGHEIIAHIAAGALTAPARAQVSALLGGEARAAMVGAANWADEIRDARPETTQWHFVDIELDAPGYRPASDCPNDDCVVAQIVRDEALLADRRQPPARRAEALKFLIHFAGDVHQPLHASDDHDRGGNDIRLRLGRYRTNMHHLWDTVLVEDMGNDAGAIAVGIAAQVTPQQRAGWQSGTPADWANESFAVARRDIYARLPPDSRYRPLDLPRGYERDEIAAVRLQLAKGGYRLAFLLNTVLK